MTWRELLPFGCVTCTTCHRTTVCFSASQAVDPCASSCRQPGKFVKACHCALFRHDLCHLHSSIPALQSLREMRIFPITRVASIRAIALQGMTRRWRLALDFADFTADSGMANRNPNAELISIPIQTDGCNSMDGFSVPMAVFHKSHTSLGFDQERSTPSEQYRGHYENQWKGIRPRRDRFVRSACDPFGMRCAATGFQCVLLGRTASDGHARGQMDAAAWRGLHPDHHTARPDGDAG